ncbi:peptidoglycan-associated lipoprotein Pal [Hydrogenophaga sp.]|uniref:peptidoglycan-associated lipoprotein Pal n=1 Tax=Hydrogenophaga sp. TaxID=1904254 RepID=UPI00286D982A|nr:peptidoglycan-associated lipoprotein Pal [Hydrogenophaga sp.]
MTVSLVVAAGLAGCASSVPLEEVPVVDRAATAVSPLGQGAVTAPSATSGGADQRSVSPVQVSPTEAPQPDAMTRVVYFDYDSFEIKRDFAGMLEANAKYLMADGKRRLALEGHTDERGGREYNLALGQKRAEAVRRALTLLGVSDKQVEPVSFGEEKPAANGFTEEAYAKNRRVEFTYR